VDNELEYMKRKAKNKYSAEINDNVNPGLLSPVRGGSELYLMSHEAKVNVEAVTSDYLKTASGLDEGENELRAMRKSKEHYEDGV
jgi:hypothetical protein